MEIMENIINSKILDCVCVQDCFVSYMRVS